MCCSTPQRGFWIAFFGPDGVGKSAVIHRLQECREARTPALVRFHFRPRFRRGEGGGRPVIAPHAQNPRSAIVSILKLVYWLVDCWFGYAFAIVPMRRRGRLVVFDRYYPDILIDPVRYRLPLRVMRFAAALVSIAPRPDLYVLLDAPAQLVQQRKQEISLAESQRQRSAYLKLFGTLNRTLVLNASSPVDVVAHDVSAVLSTFLINSQPKRSRRVPARFRST